MNRLDATTRANVLNCLIEGCCIRSTVRMTGDKDQGFAAISIRNAINRGDFEGPRMFVAPHFFGPLGGHGDLNDVAPDWEGHVEGQVIHAGIHNMQEAVRRERKYGADLIKIMVTGGVMSQNDDPSVQGFSDEELQALAEEAGRAGPGAVGLRGPALQHPAEQVFVLGVDRHGRRL